MSSPRPYAMRKRPVTMMVLVVLIVGSLVLGGLAAFGGGGGQQSGEPGGRAGDDTIQPLPEDHPVHTLARRDADDPLALGSVDAPVVMIEYSDFQCAFCGIHARDTEPELIEEYVDTGTLRIEFRNFPVFGPESDAAARASWAAGRQGRFREFHGAAFEDEFHQNSGRFDDDGVLELAERAGVPDLDQFTADMESVEAGEAVELDAEEGYELGIDSTPAFLINGHPVLGAKPIDTFRDTIDQLHEAATQP